MSLQLLAAVGPHMHEFSTWRTYATAVLLGISIAGRGQCANLESSQAEAEAAFAVAQRAMAEHSWAEAELNYERVLMFNPDHAEARVQFAVLLAQRGKRDAASAFLESLIEDERTPHSHRLRLMALLKQLQQGQTLTLLTKPWATEDAVVHMRSTFGYASNPFSRASIDGLTLTFPDGSANLPVTQNIHPAPQITNSLTYIGSNQCGLNIMDQRWGGTEQYFSNRLMLFCNNVGELQNSQAFVLQRRSIDASVRTSVGLVWQQAGARVSIQAFKEPDYERQGLSARIDRHFELAKGGHATLYAEAETSNANSPAYVKQGYWQEWALTSTLSLTAQYSFQKDLSGYSPLLSRDVARSLTYAELGIERRWAVQSGWSFGTAAQISQRWSNLPLFEFRDISIQLQIQRRL